jgi:hypothetical protein
MTIFFSKSAFRKPKIAEQSPQTPMKMGSSELCPMSFRDLVSIKKRNTLKAISK